MSGSIRGRTKPYLIEQYGIGRVEKSSLYAILLEDLLGKFKKKGYTMRLFSECNLDRVRQKDS